MGRFSNMFGLRPEADVIVNPHKWEALETDADIANPGAAPTFKPINIHRIPLERPFNFTGGGYEELVLTLWQTRDGAQTKEELPAFPIRRRMDVDHVLKFEVLDELGVDVGVGFILGQAKR